MNLEAVTWGRHMTHLARPGEEMTLCGRPKPAFLYESPWQGDRDYICKKCLKVIDQERYQGMKALTLYQPWATLVAVGAKKIETRSWATSYRGPLAIHASKNAAYINSRTKKYIGYEKPFYDVLTALGMEFGALPKGCILATCTLVDVVRIDPITSEPGCEAFQHNEREWLLNGQERAFGNYAEGRYMWLLDNVRILATPVRVNGAMGLWRVNL